VWVWVGDKAVGGGRGTWRFALNVALIICHEIFMNVRREQASKHI